VKWTDPKSIRAQLQRCWDRGELLAGMVTGDDSFPRRLILKGPTSAQLAEQFDQVALRTVGIGDDSGRPFRRESNHGPGVPSARAFLKTRDQEQGEVMDRNDAARRGGQNLIARGNGRCYVLSGCPDSLPEDFFARRGFETG